MTNKQDQMYRKKNKSSRKMTVVREIGASERGKEQLLRESETTKTKKSRKTKKKIVPTK
jgi:hypothetical protein